MSVESSALEVRGFNKNIEVPKIRVVILILLKHKCLIHTSLSIILQSDPEPLTVSLETRFKFRCFSSFFFFFLFFGLGFKQSVRSRDFEHEDQGLGSSSCVRTWV